MSPDKLGVVATDETHLKVTLSRPLPWFPSMVANVAMFPVPQKVIAESGEDWTRPGKLVGNGAYQLQERVVNEKIVLVRNTHYWDNAKTVLTKVTFIPINQESSATKRYRAGDIDITESFPKNMYQKLLKDIPGQVYTPPQLGTYYYAFNTQKGPTADARVRLALSMEHRPPHYRGKSAGHRRETGMAFHPGRDGRLHAAAELSAAAQPAGAECAGQNLAARRRLRPG